MKSCFAMMNIELDPFDKIEMLYVEQTEDILPGYFEDILKSVDKP